MGLHDAMVWNFLVGHAFMFRLTAWQDGPSKLNAPGSIVFWQKKREWEWTIGPCTAARDRRSHQQ